MLRIVHAILLLSMVLRTEAQAVVIEINEWDNKTKAGWAYSADPLKPAIDGTANTCPGGNRLRAKYDPGTYSTSIGGNRAEFTTSGKNDLYWGHWLQYSVPFTWNPVGTKIDYWTMGGLSIDGVHRDNFLVMTHFFGTNGGGNSLTFTQQLNGSPGTQNRGPNISSPPIVPGPCYWIEFHGRLNTVGQADGLFEAWLDDQLVMQHNNVTFRTTNVTWGILSHSPEWGGGGGTIPSTCSIGAPGYPCPQYTWVDHTVVSTTRIGRPGGTGGDTTAPATPGTLVLTQAMEWLSAARQSATQWLYGFDVFAAKR